MRKLPRVEPKREGGKEKERERKKIKKKNDEKIRRLAQEV